MRVLLFAAVAAGALLGGGYLWRDPGPESASDPSRLAGPPLRIPVEVIETGEKPRRHEVELRR